MCQNASNQENQISEHYGDFSFISAAKFFKHRFIKNYIIYSSVLFLIFIILLIFIGFNYHYISSESINIFFH